MNLAATAEHDLYGHPVTEIDQGQPDALGVGMIPHLNDPTGDDPTTPTSIPSDGHGAVILAHGECYRSIRSDHNDSKAARACLAWSGLMSMSALESTLGLVT